MTEDITAFLKARLDEDEAVAEEASPGHTGHDLFVIDDDYRHDTIAIPADRVLRGVEAKRRIVDDFASSTRNAAAPYWPNDQREREQQHAHALLGVLYLLASEWSTHAEFRPEWSP